MTEEYISGYLEAISRVKDILTPYLGGTNQFFSIDKNIKKSLSENVKDYVLKYKEWYDKYENSSPLQTKFDKLQFVEIENWVEKFPNIISIWTCDKELSNQNGKNGYHLSEYLVNFLLKDFFRNQEVKVYKMLPDSEFWHWSDHISEDYIFESDTKIFILHFGEST
jgi:hypothetical protein